MMGECYPLYLSVHEHATEYKRKAIPREFFQRIAEELCDVNSFLVVRRPDGKIIGFMMGGISGTIDSPFFVGFDYRYVKQYSLYYYMIWDEIAYAIGQRCQEIDVGLTNYFIKQGLGARPEPLGMMAKFRVPLLGNLLTRIAPSVLSEPQPVSRRHHNTR